MYSYSTPPLSLKCNWFILRFRESCSHPMSQISLIFSHMMPIVIVVSKFITFLFYSYAYSPIDLRRRRRRRIPCLSATLQYRVLSEDRFNSPIFSLQLLLAVALDRRPAWLRVLPLNYLSYPDTLTNHILVTWTCCMSHVVCVLSDGWSETNSP